MTTTVVFQTRDGQAVSRLEEALETDGRSVVSRYLTREGLHSLSITGEDVRRAVRLTLARLGYDLR
jgi:hypothetical protein